MYVVFQNKIEKNPLDTIYNFLSRNNMLIAEQYYNWCGFKLSIGMYILRITN